LIWFTDSARSPICKRLDSEVFNTHEFKKWSENNVILLRVDLSPRERESNLRKKKLKYAQALRKKFKISGNPTVLMIDFDGQSLGRYKGYKGGQGPFYLGRLEQAGKIITEQYFTWYPDLQKKRYRHWEGRNGVKLLAKLIHYNEGTLQVVEPNGRRTTFNEKNLSAKDQKWIVQEKNRRN